MLGPHVPAGRKRIHVDEVRGGVVRDSNIPLILLHFFIHSNEVSSSS